MTNAKITPMKPTLLALLLINFAISASSQGTAPIRNLSKAKLYYITQCKSYFRESRYPQLKTDTPKVSLQLVHFFKIEGLADRSLEQKINDQLLLVYCIPENELVQSMILKYCNPNKFCMDYCDTCNLLKGYMIESTSLIKDSIYERFEIIPDSNIILNFCDSIIKHPTYTEGRDNYKAKKIRLIRNWGFHLSWSIVKDNLMVFNINAWNYPKLPTEHVFAEDNHRTEEIGHRVKNYSFQSNEYTFMFDIKSGNLLTFWDLIKQNKRYDFMEYFDRLNNAKYTNDSIFSRYNLYVEFPDSFYDFLIYHYDSISVNNALLKPNYDFRRAGFYDHLGTNPHFYFSTEIKERKCIYLHGVGRFGQYIVNPFFDSNYGVNANYPIYETDIIAIPRKKLKKYMKPFYYKLLFNH